MTTTPDTVHAAEATTDPARLDAYRADQTTSPAMPTPTGAIGGTARPTASTTIRTARPDFEEEPTSMFQRVLVGVFVAIPLVALAAAIPLLWGWGLGWHDVVIALAFYWLSGLGITTLPGLRSGRTDAAACAFPAYIPAAYWLTPPTSFANPAVTVGRPRAVALGLRPRGGGRPAAQRRARRDRPELGARRRPRPGGGRPRRRRPRPLPVPRRPTRRDRRPPRRTRLVNRPVVLFLGVHSAGR